MEPLIGMRGPSDAYKTPARYSDAPIGYEPKSKDTGTDMSQQVSYSKIPDSMIKVLPEWGYDAVTRDDFTTKFARMLKSIGAVYLVRNKRIECSTGEHIQPSSQEAKNTDGQGLFFSPSKDKQTAAQARYGDDQEPGHGTATYPHASAKQAGVATGVKPPTEDLDFYNERRLPQQSAATVRPAAGATSLRRNATPRPPTPARTAVNIPARTAVNISARTAAPQREHAGAPRSHLRCSNRGANGSSAFADRPSFHQDLSSDSSEAEGKHESQTGYGQHAQMPSRQRSHRQQAQTTPSWMDGGRSSQPYRHAGVHRTTPAVPVMPAEERHRLEFMKLRRELERKDEQRAIELSSMAHTLQTIQAQLQESQQLQRVMLTKSQAGSIYTHTGAEEWIVEERLKTDFDETFRYWHVQSQRWENGAETILRSRVYGYLVKKLPDEMTRRVPENDVLSIYHNIVRVNNRSAEAQVVTITTRVTSSKKSGRPMTSWLNELYQDIESLEKLRRPMKMSMVRTIILASLSGDKRYDLAVRDMHAHPDWEISEIRAHLEAVATECGDLIPDKSFLRKQAKRARNRANRVAKRAGAQQPDLPQQTVEAAPARPQANFGQKAHGGGTRPNGKGNSKAEGAITDKQKRDRLRNEICPDHLAGACSRGDSCYRRHMSVGEVKEWVKRKGSSGNKPTESKGQKGNNSSGGQSCYQFKQNGECTFGDNCRYPHIDSHGVVVKVARARTIKSATKSYGASARPIPTKLDEG